MTTIQAATAAMEEAQKRFQLVISDYESGKADLLLLRAAAGEVKECTWALRKAHHEAKTKGEVKRQ